MPRRPRRPARARPPHPPARTWLSALVDVRVYFGRDSDGDAVAALAAQHFPAARREVARADLCRPELLIEVEGVAEEEAPPPLSSD